MKSPAFVLWFFFVILSLVSFSPVYAQKHAGPFPQHLGPSCEFSVSGLCFGDTAFFVNHTIRMMSPEWEIRDPSGSMLFISQDTNIKFFFPSPGTYSVTLKANNGHPDSLTKVLNIGSATVADFIFQQCTNRFVNMSACSSNFYWDFGDGNTSTAPIPVHVYADTGSYTVSLIASNGIVSDTVAKQVQVYGLGFPTGQFSFHQSNDTVFFAGDTLGTNFSWDFGDQTFDTAMNPAHVYADTGDYLVFVTVSNYCGLYIYSQTIHVGSPAGLQPTGQPACSFIFHPNPVASGSAVLFEGCREENIIVKLMDLVGKELGTCLIPDGGRREFRLPQAAGGIYFLQIFSGKDLLEVQKLVVE